MNFELPNSSKEKVALAIYDSKPSAEEMKQGKKPAFLTTKDLNTPAVVYTAGHLGSYYIDLRVVPSFRQQYDTIVTQLCWYIDTILGENFDWVVSSESAGISWGQSVADYFRKPFSFGRKEVKEYGTAKTIEGYIQTGSTGIIVDDLSTTLKSSTITANGIRKEGARPSKTFVIFDRMQYTNKQLEELGTEFHALVNSLEFVNIGLATKKLDEEIGKQILKYHENEPEYALEIIQKNSDFVRKHPKFSDIIAGYEKTYQTTNDEKEKSKWLEVVQTLKTFNKD